MAKGRGYANSSKSLNRLNEAKALKVEIENKKMLGLLIPYEEVYPMVSTIINQVVSQFHSFDVLLAQRLSDVSDPNEIKAIVAEERDKIFSPFHEYGEKELKRLEDEKRIEELADRKLLLEADKRVKKALQEEIEEDEEYEEDEEIESLDTKDFQDEDDLREPETLEAQRVRPKPSLVTKPQKKHKKKAKKKKTSSSRLTALIAKIDGEEIQSKGKRKIVCEDGSKRSKKTPAKRYKR